MIEFEEHSKKLFSIVLILMSVSVILLGVIFLLKALSPVLLPLTLVYIISIILRLPYEWLNNKLGKAFLSFSIIFAILSLIVVIITYTFGVDFLTQYNSLVSSLSAKIPIAIKYLEPYFPILAEQLSTFELDENIRVLFSGNLLTSIVTSTTAIVRYIGYSTFSIIMSLVTWIVIPSFIYILVTKPLQEKDIKSIFLIIGKVPSEQIAKNFIICRKSLEVYFSKQIFLSFLHLIILYSVFEFFNFGGSIALAVIFSLLNLIPNLGSMLLLLVSPILAMLCNVNIDGVPENYWFGALVAFFLGVVLLVFDNMHLLFPLLIKKLSKYITSWNQGLSVHSAIITISIIFWGYVLDGVFGLVLSVPITILIATLIKQES